LFGAQFRRHGLEVRSSPSEGGSLDLEHWWQSPDTARTVLQEYAKLLAYIPQGALW
jgi:hypothetical protein